MSLLLTVLLWSLLIVANEHMNPSVCRAESTHSFGTEIFTLSLHSLVCFECSYLIEVRFVFKVGNVSAQCVSVPLLAHSGPSHFSGMPNDASDFGQLSLFSTNTSSLMLIMLERWHFVLANKWVGGGFSLKSCRNTLDLSFHGRTFLTILNAIYVLESSSWKSCEGCFLGFFH